MNKKYKMMAGYNPGISNTLNFSIILLGQNLSSQVIQLVLPNQVKKY